MMKMSIFGLMVVMTQSEIPKTPIFPKPDFPASELIELENQWDNYFRWKYLNFPIDQRPKTEVDWSKFLAPKYEASVEYQLLDRTRVDLINREYVFEVDWANKSLKWAEAIGQAGWYSINTHRKPAVLLLVPDKEEGTMRNIYRCRATCATYKVDIFVEDLTKYTN